MRPDSRHVSDRAFLPFAALATLSVFILACGALSGTASDVPGGDTQEGTEAAQAQATAGPATEEVSPALGKLLDACALIPAAEVETFLGEGSPITNDARRSYWHPDEGGRTFYDCRFRNTLSGEGVDIMVEVFSDPADALGELQSMVDFYNDRLEEEGLEPMLEVNGLGDKAYRYTTAPEGYTVPDVYLSSGNYLISVTVNYPGSTPEEVLVHFETALAFAQNALPQLPADISTIMLDQDLSLDTPSQPAGKPLEACGLVTRDEAQVFMNSPIVAEESTSGWDLGGFYTYECSYMDSSFDGTDIWAYQWLDMDFFNSLLEGQTIEEVSGIGDRAFRHDPVNYADFTVVSGNTSISLFFSTEPEFERVLELAEMALSRMP